MAVPPSHWEASVVILCAMSAWTGQFHISSYKTTAKKQKGMLEEIIKTFFLGLCAKEKQNENLKLEPLSKCCWVVQLFKADHYCKIKLNNHFDKGSRMHMTHYTIYLFTTTQPSVNYPYHIQRIRYILQSMEIIQHI